MLTFTEYLNKGTEISNHLTEEVLEEAYSPEMKRLMPADKLKELSSYMTKNHLSVQKADFEKLSPNWEISDLANYQYCFILTKDNELVITSRRFDNETQHSFRYPRNYRSRTNIVDETFKKKVLHIFGMRDIENSMVGDLQNTRAAIDKIRAVAKKRKFEVTSAKFDETGKYPYVRLENIKEGFDFCNIIIEYEHGAWSVRFECDSTKKFLVSQINMFAYILDRADSLCKDLEHIKFTDTHL